MTFREQYEDRRLLPGLTEDQPLDVRHMCPEDGCVKPVGSATVANPFCPVCLGSGSVTSERLDRWMVEQHAKGRRGEL